jgi:hypothetical protein
MSEKKRFVILFFLLIVAVATTVYLRTNIGGNFVEGL